MRIKKLLLNLLLALYSLNALVLWVALLLVSYGMYYEHRVAEPSYCTHGGGGEGLILVYLVAVPCYGLHCLLSFVAIGRSLAFKLFTWATLLVFPMAMYFGLPCTS